MRMSQERSDVSRPFPGPLAALGLTLAAWWAVFAWSAVAARLAPAQLALATALVVGYAGTGALALRGIGRPRLERIAGGRPAARHLGPILLLVPAVFPALEIQAAVRALLGSRPDSAYFEWGRGIGNASSDLAVVAGLLLLAGLLPALSEGFFRGLLQQGLVDRLGPARGILLAGALYGAMTAGVRPDVATWSGIFWGTFALGALYGLVRRWTGSLGASILLHAGGALVLFVVALSGASTRIPVLTAPGRHVPLALVAVSAASVGVGLLWLRAVRAR